MRWLVDNWELLTGLATVVLASVAQLLTRHPDVAQGALRWVLLAIDALAVFKAPGSDIGRGQMRGLGGLKLPLLHRSPPAAPTVDNRAGAKR